MRRFVEMAEAQVTSGDLASAGHLMSYAFEFVPLPGVTTDFFAILAPACCRLLRGCRCVLAVDGNFVRPSEAVMSFASPVVDGGSSTQQQAAKTAELVASLGLAFTHPAVSISPPLAREIGVRCVDASLLTELLADLCTTHWRRCEDVDGEWLAWVLRELQGDPQLSKQLPTLRKLRMLPLTDGSLGCTELAPVYEASDTLSRQLAAFLPCCTALAARLRLMTSGLVQQLARRQATSILSRLRVERISHEQLVRSLLVPLLAEEATPLQELPLLLGFAKEQSAYCPALGRGGGLERCLVEAHARLLTIDGDAIVLGNPRMQLHLGPSLWPTVSSGGKGGRAQPKPAFDFVPSSPPSAWKVVALPSGAEGDREAWQTLFGNLGVGWFPAVVPVEGVFGDWESPALEALFEDLIGRRDFQRLRALNEAVNEKWLSLLRSKLVVGATAPDTLIISPESAQPTRLLTLLRTHSWLVGTTGELHRPGEVWVANEQVRSLLGSRVPYAATTLPQELNLVLGMIAQPTPSTLLPLLRAWGAEPSCEGSIDEMTRLLELVGTWSAASPEVHAELSIVPCIWLPDLKSNDGMRGGMHGAGRIGRFHLPSLCAWEDPAQLIDVTDPTNPLRELMAQLASHAGLRVLAQAYDLRNLYPVQENLANLGMALAPSIEHYVSILKAAAAASGPLCFASVNRATQASLATCYSIFKLFASQEWWMHVYKSHGQPPTAEAISTSREHSLAEALCFVRVRLVEALQGAAIFPAADDEWRTLDDLYFFVPPPLPGRPLATAM